MGFCEINRTGKLLCNDHRKLTKQKLILHATSITNTYVGAASKDPSAGAVLPGAMVEGMSRDVLPYPSPPSGDMKKVLSKCAEFVASSNVARFRAVDSEDIACNHQRHLSNQIREPKATSHRNLL
jgi:hypothetical protein